MLTSVGTDVRPPGDTGDPTLTLGFIMEQVAGHVTHYTTLRAAVERDATVRPVWREITYRQPGGSLERLHARLPWLPYYPFGVARAAIQVRQALTGERYDAALLNSRVATFFPRAVRRLPCLFDTDVTPAQLDTLPGYAGPADPAPVAALKRRLFRAFLAGLDGVIAWSHWAADSFVHDYGLPPERVTVIPPGVDLAFWRPGAPARSSDGGPLRILFVGGDFRRKGGPELLAWHATQPAGRAELHVVTREPVAARPGVHVHHGLQPNTAPLLRLYQTADLFVLPSHGECFGIATTEAMACGLPVVVTDVGGVADIVTPGENGFLTPPGDGRALAAALEALLADEEARRRLGRAGRARVEAHFDAAETSARRLALLKRAARSRRPPTPGAPAR